MLFVDTLEQSKSGIGADVHFAQLRKVYGR